MQTTTETESHMGNKDISFDFSDFPTIVTKRLILREMSPEDVNALLKLFGNAEVVRFIEMQPLRTIEQANEWLKWMGGLYAARDGLRWGVTLRDGTFIGSAGFHRWNKEAHYATIGCDIAHTYWGSGYGQEAMRELIDFGLSQMKLNRIEADVLQGNMRSIHVMEKLGFRKEGVLRQRLLKGGKYYDVYVFGLLRQEYQRE